MEKEEKDSKDYNEWIDKKQKEIYESKRELEKQSYDAIKYMRKTNKRELGLHDRRNEKIILHSISKSKYTIIGY